MNLKESFAENLKRIRKQRGLTQEELAELVNVAPRHISFIETAKSFPSSDLLERLSNALNTNYADFFTYEKEISREETIKYISEIIKKFDNKKLKYIYKMVKEL
jgi:transcriptional regulator with XRE-family HTH domain